MKALFVFVFFFVSCSAKKNIQPETPLEQPIVVVEPKNFNSVKIEKVETLDQEILSLAQNLIDMRKVIRRVADLRIGPGIEFNLQDWNFAHGDAVVILEKSNQWFKVSSLDGKKFGWIHKKTLSEQKLSSKSKNEELNVRVESKVFPTVFAATRVQQVYSYLKKETIQLEIPRGTSLKMLREENGRKLLWLAQHNIVFWGDSNEFL